MCGHVWGRDRIHGFLPVMLPCVKAGHTEQMDPGRDRVDILVGSGCDDFPIFVLLCRWKSQFAYCGGIWGRSLVVEEIFLWYNGRCRLKTALPSGGVH